MKVLILGSGGREHALAWKLSRSPLLTQLLCAPGNPGTARMATNIPVAADDVSGVVNAALAHRVDLVVVGPEAPLVHGVVDALGAKSVPAFGPVAGAAQLEGSKAFAKEVMESAGVPTAPFRVFNSASDAEAFVKRGSGAVVKADGLAAGKGVTVARTAEEAVAAVRALSKLSEAGKRLVVEERLDGEEVSIIALCDGERYLLLPPAQDHKRVGDGDTGPNTGGMGAYAPVPTVDAPMMRMIGETIIAPTLVEIGRRGFSFRGALYAGLMLTRSGPQVLEFNCRFGDPEAQALVLQLDQDLLPLLMASARSSLTPTPLPLGEGCSVAVVLASEGYPQSPRLGVPISGLESLPDSICAFHAGTRFDDGRLLTAGGRVLTLCARGATLAEARSSVYQAISKVHFQGMHFRRDIAAKTGS